MLPNGHLRCLFAQLIRKYQLNNVFAIYIILTHKSSTIVNQLNRLFIDYN
jgi:hypothetical protein